MDVFLEKIVKKKSETKDSLITVGIVVVTLIVWVIALNLLGSFSLIVCVAAGYGAYILLRRKNLEFEYIVTNGEIDIDKIMGKSSRKRIFSANCKDFEIVAKVNSDKYTTEMKNIKSKLMAASHMQSEDLYFFVANYKATRTIVFFEPDVKMLENFRMFIPRKVFI